MDKIKSYCFDDCFGNLDQLREDTGLTYKTKNIQIPVEKNIKIDCLYIFGMNPNQADYQDAPIETKKANYDNVLSQCGVLRTHGYRK
jgi:hypothetical protein